MEDREKITWYRNRAYDLWTADDLEIGTRVAVAEDGAWVEAWVWIDTPNFDDVEVLDRLADLEDEIRKENDEDQEDAVS